MEGGSLVVKLDWLVVVGVEVGVLVSAVVLSVEWFDVVSLVLGVVVDVSVVVVIIVVVVKLPSRLSKDWKAPNMNVLSKLSIPVQLQITPPLPTSAEHLPSFPSTVHLKLFPPNLLNMAQVVVSFETPFSSAPSPSRYSSCNCTFETSLGQSR